MPLVRGEEPCPTTTSRYCGDLLGCHHLCRWHRWPGGAVWGRGWGALGAWAPRAQVVPRVAVLCNKVVGEVSDFVAKNALFPALSCPRRVVVVAACIQPPVVAANALEQQATSFR